jgi:hypothetical protein
MSTKLSLEEILRNLEQQVAFHRDQAALHAQQEELHRSQRAVHEAELEKVSRHLESLRTVAVPASELVAPVAPAKPDVDVGLNPTLTALIARILEGRPKDEPFGARAMTAEINRRFRQALGRDADVRSVGSALRRMHQQGRIRLVREGGAVREGLYTRM